MLSVDGEKRVEASIPVMSRVDIRVLAEMVMYWDSIGENIRSMSQLVNWSMSLCSQILSTNNILPKSIDSMLEANMFLTDRGLYQASMRKRGAGKIVRGRQLENLRIEGIDPKFRGKEGNREYKLAHNKHTIDPAPSVSNGTRRNKTAEEIALDHKAWDDAQVKIAELEAKEKKEAYEAIGLGGEDEGIKYDKKGMAILVHRTNDQYTMKDKIRDDKLKLVKTLESVNRESGSGDQIRMKSEEELDADDARREKKEADYQKAQNFIPSATA